MAQQVDRSEGARAAAQRVLAALPRAVEGLGQLAASLEPEGARPFAAEAVSVEPVPISMESVEQLAEGFRGAVQSLEQGPLAREPAGTPGTSDSAGIIDSIEQAATSIQAFVASLETEGAGNVDVAEVFRLGKLSGAAELMVGTLEDVPTQNVR